MGRPSTLALSNSLTAFSAKEAVLKVAKAVPSERLVSLLRWMITFTTWKFKKEQRLVTT